MNVEMGKRILEIRKSMNMNKEQFSKLIGISGQYLGTVEAGVHGLSLDSLINLCTATHTSADYILFGKKNITNENLKEIFAGVNEEQISTAFDALEHISIYIKLCAMQDEEDEALERAEI